MKRVVFAGAVTLAGLAAVLSYRTRPIPATTVTPSPAATPSGVTGPRAPSPVTATGETVVTPYGPVQVRVSEVGGRISDVEALQLPNGNVNSVQIANYAVPILRREAIHADSAHIDVVTGATETSLGYIQSLQSALDAAARSRP